MLTNKEKFLLLVSDEKCDTLVRTEADGKKVFKKKEPFNTLDEAILEAKRMNCKESTIHKLFAYKCTYCHKYHIGRNSKILSDKDREKYRKELGVSVKILGKIDLDKDKKGFKVLGWIDLDKIKY